MEVRLQELDDRRRIMGESINAMENRLTIYKDHLVKKEEEALKRRKAEIEEQKLRAQQEKLLQKDQKGVPLKSNFKKRPSTQSTKGRERDSKSVTSAS